MPSTVPRIAALLALLTLAACTEGDHERPAPVPAPAPGGTPTAAPVAAGPPDDAALGAALPAVEDLGVGGDHTACLAGVQTCPWPSGSPDPGLSWVRAAEGARGAPGARWAEVLVSGQGSTTLRRLFLRDARLGCPVGEWAEPGDPRGLHPGLPREGAGRLDRIELGGFRGLHCSMAVGPPGGPRHEEHWIRAVRDDVRLEVSASSEPLLLRLFAGYVERLHWA